MTYLQMQQVSSRFSHRNLCHKLFFCERTIRANYALRILEKLGSKFLKINFDPVFPKSSLEWAMFEEDYTMDAR